MSETEYKVKRIAATEASCLKSGAGNVFTFGSAESLILFRRVACFV
jgi:hypothetical protein